MPGGAPGVPGDLAMRLAAGLLLLAALFVSIARADETADEMVGKARVLLKDGKTEAGLAVLGKAIERDPKNFEALLLRASLREAMTQYAPSIEDLTRVIELKPKSAVLYDRRGAVQFKAGKIKESVEDFDKAIELKPDLGPGHWQRGISLYYVGRFDDGRKQFEGYEKVDTNDVENAVWHFLCVARKDGVDKARAALLKIGNDRRVPMMQVYSMFAGKLKPEDVMTAVREGEPKDAELNKRLFYAHLYLGLWAEVNGDAKTALAHLNKATDDHPFGHYMWDVARVHRDLLRQAKDKEK
jgi:lipoprotein NlpI